MSLAGCLFAKGMLVACWWQAPGQPDTAGAGSRPAGRRRDDQQRGRHAAGRVASHRRWPPSPHVRHRPAGGGCPDQAAAETWAVMSIWPPPDRRMCRGRAGQPAGAPVPGEVGRW